ncbi:hypothetical protein RRG08_059166 [Elysia crispata]|uniref:Uncharacterized protein n=1 Tax=Elysia crispata TaxID=231223 RepID=A0AAE1B399_9GAST|nr:hypothetical protein RRG08_059166 [Elysia crispata]
MYTNLVNVSSNQLAYRVADICLSQESFRRDHIDPSPVLVKWSERNRNSEVVLYEMTQHSRASLALLRGQVLRFSPWMSSGEVGVQGKWCLTCPGTLRAEFHLSSTGSGH